jgi:hypothetical protein
MIIHYIKKATRLKWLIVGVTGFEPVTLCL